MIGNMANDWWTRLRVRIAWGIRRPGVLRGLDRAIKGDRNAGKVLTGIPNDRRKCLCGNHAYNVVCATELIYEGFSPGVYSVIQKPWFKTESDPEPEGGPPWTPGDSQAWLTTEGVQLPRVILGPVEGAFVGVLRDEWRYSKQTAVDPGTGRFVAGQRFLPNRDGVFKGTLQDGERYFFAYDWTRPAYCGAKLTELGFRPEDLTP